MTLKVNTTLETALHELGYINHSHHTIGKLAYLSLASNITSEPGERDYLFLGDDILQEPDCSPEMHVTDSTGGLTRVLKVHP